MSIPQAGSASLSAFLEQPLDGEDFSFDAQRALEELRASEPELQAEDLDLDGFDPDDEEVDDDLIKFQEDDIIKEALLKGVDLSLYARQIEADLRSQEQLCVNDYLEHAEDIAELHSQIRGSDEILARMEDILGVFKTELGSISAEIRLLQDQSSSMDVRLRNRKDVESELSGLVDSLLLPEERVHALVSSPVGPDFVPEVMFLCKKIRALRRPEVRSTRAADDVAPVVASLRQKVASRIRAWLLAQFNGLRKPRTNLQVKQGLLLRARALWRALEELARDDPAVQAICKELKEGYVTTMSLIYQGKFKTYLASMRKRLVKFQVAKTDVLGLDESRSGGLFSAKRSSEQLSKVFALGQRHAVLTDVEKDYIVYRVAQSSGQRFPFERVFRSAQRLLMDSAASEFNFIAQFFGRPGTAEESDPNSPRSESPGSPSASGEPPEELPEAFGEEPADPALERFESQLREIQGVPVDEEALDLPVVPGINTGGLGPSLSIPPVRADRLAPQELRRAQALFARVFGGALGLFGTWLDEQLQLSQDSVGALLLLRVLAQHNAVMQSARVSCLDSYFDRVNLQLWPAFKAAFDANLWSLRQVKDALVKRGQTEPHPVTLRYAQYAAALLFLNQGYQDGILTHNLALLRMEMEKLLQRSAAVVKDARAQMVFLIANYSLVLRVLRSAQSEWLACSLAHVPSAVQGGELPQQQQQQQQQQQAREEEELKQSQQDAEAELAGKRGRQIVQQGPPPQLQLDLSVESEEARVFSDLMARQVGLYVEFQVQEKFGRLVRFVQEQEHLLGVEENNPAAAAAVSAISEKTLEDVVQQFSREWRSGMSNMHDSVMKDFSNLGSENAGSFFDREAQKDTAREILKRAMIQLVLYYQRFQNLIQKWTHQRNGQPQPRFLKDIVNIQAIKAEIKKYGRQEL